MSGGADGDCDTHLEDEETDEVPELPSMSAVMRAKEQNPMMFVSGYEEDDGGIELPENPDSPGERLLTAAEYGNSDVVTKLVDTTPDLINYRDADGYTALHRACSEDQVDAARILIAKEAPVDVTSDQGWTPLHSASHWNSHRCVRLLLESGANINARTQGGLTPLHITCRGNAVDTRESLIILLNEPGIDLTIRNNAGDTAYDLAIRNGHFVHLFEPHLPPIGRV